MTHPLILASRSPQRAAILEQLGVAFEARPAAVEELGQGDPEHVARQNALAKARASAVAGRLTLGVDTIVALDGRLYGKARDEGDARAHAGEPLRPRAPGVERRRLIEGG